MPKPQNFLGALRAPGGFLKNSAFASRPGQGLDRSLLFDMGWGGGGELADAPSLQLGDADGGMGFENAGGFRRPPPPSQAHLIYLRP